MKDMERQGFEDAWKDAFGKAEVSPPENIWTNIELDLEKAEGEKMKRRLLFYKLTAAASITFALCVAGVGAYYVKSINNASGYVASNKTINANRTIDNSNQISNSTAAKNGNQVDVNDEPLESNSNGSNKLDDLLKENGAQSEHNQMSANSSLAVTQNRSANDVDGEAHATEGNQRNIVRKEDAIDQNTIAAKQDSKSNDGVIVREESLAKNANSKEAYNIENNNKSLQKAGVDTNDGSQTSIAMIQKPSHNSLLTSKRVIFTSAPKEEVDPFIVMMAKLEQRERELREGKEPQKKNEQEKQINRNTWASLGFARGSFTSPNADISTVSSKFDQQDRGSGLLSARSNFSNDAKKEVAQGLGKRSGIAYSVGINIGTYLTKHWILQGGFNYLNQMSVYETSLTTSNAGNGYNLYTVKDVAYAANSDVNNSQTASPYDVNNNIEYLSVPVQTGYVVRPQHKLGIQINAGVATELFLRSVARAMVNDVQQTVKESWGNGSSYRTVNFSGLLGAEINYKIGSHYSVGLSPGIKCPFSSIYKTEVGIKSKPLTMDVGLRFKYIFQ
jgi:hypothetical protein